MEFIVTEINQCDLITIIGRIDSFSTPQLDEVLKTLVGNDHYNIIVNLQDVSYISSSGILAFVKIQRKFKRENRGEIVFVNVPNLVFSSFEMAGFNTVFNFFDDIPAATGHFSGIS